jgi:Flp pilus assembly protein TadG
MRPWASGFRRDQSGATAVEFSLILLPFLTMLFGGFEFARLSWTREALQEVAISGARCMGVIASDCASGGSYDASSTKTYMHDRARSLGVNVPTANIAVDRAATCAGVSNGTLNFSSVTVTHTFSTVAPQLIEALAGSTALSATACFPNYK